MDHRNGEGKDYMEDVLDGDVPAVAGII